ncbi:MAG: exo-alpha-sialidase [Ruminococcaceae bacterium]|nr:exo-alpha-sialidase [Oscillospiraceae bacterium]
MKKIFGFIIVLCLSVALLGLVSSAALPIKVTVETSSGDISSLAVPSGGLFGGWFTTEEAATALDVTMAASNDYSGTVYGATVEKGNYGFSIPKVEFASDVNGIRYLVKFNKEMRSTVEGLNSLNRKGFNGTLTPKNEHATDIGYGGVVAINIDTNGKLTKKEGTNVKSGVVVPGVFTYAEDETTITFTVTVLGVDVPSLADEITVRPYITYADANGVKRTVYYSRTGSETGGAVSSVYEVVSEAAASGDEAAVSLLSTYTGSNYTSKTSIYNLNTYSENNSNAGGNAYIELDRSSMVELDENDHARYQNAFYPRITKVKDNLYLMTLNYAQEGMHLYYTTSTDGMTWADPKVLYNAANHTFTHESGSMKGTDDAYYATTADHCMLNDGTILCVYSRRPCSAYSLKEYAALSTLEVVRGTVSSDNSIKWSNPVSVYHGQNWEPEILQRTDGTVEIYFTHIAPMLYKYGFQDSMRSSGVGMIASTDGGNTWVPDVTTAPFAAKRVYQYAAGNLTINGNKVPFVHGQMPGVIELAAGDKMMLVAETRSVDRNYHMISKAYSNVEREWTELAIDEAGPSNVKNDVFRGAAPTLMRFVSGEVLLTYNYSSMLYTRLLNNRGTNMSTAYESNIFYNNSNTDGGFWSHATPISSHVALVSMTYKRYKGVTPETVDGNEVLHNTTVMGKVHLNHPIDATKKNMVADGNLQEWKKIKDALFVGSLTPDVQAAYRFAYDDNYIYVAIDRTDNANNRDDTNYICIATESGYVKAEISYGDYQLPSGVVGGTKNASGGRVYELSFNRAALGLTGDSILVCPGFTDVATDVDDRINGMDLNDTSTWITINLK